MSTKAASAPLTPSYAVEGDMLVIKLPLQTPTPSASGKSLTTAIIDGKPIVVGVNAYVRNKSHHRGVEAHRHTRLSLL